MHIDNSGKQIYIIHLLINKKDRDISVIKVSKKDLYEKN